VRAMAAETARRRRFLPTLSLTEQLALGVAACAVSAWVGREVFWSLQDRPSHGLYAGPCALSAEELRSAEDSVAREVRTLVQRSVSASAALSASLGPALPDELDRVRNATSALKDRAAEDAEALAALEIRAKEARERDAKVVAQLKLVEAATSEATAAAAEARALQQQAAVSPTSSDAPSEEAEALRVRLEALVAAAETALAEAETAAAEIIVTQHKKAAATTSAAAAAATEEAVAAALAAAADRADRAVDKVVADVKASLLAAKSPSSSSQQQPPERPVVTPAAPLDGELASLVERAAAKHCEADGPGAFDYALAAAGGSVVRSLTSEPYTPADRIIPTWAWHAVGRDAGVGRADEAIQQRASFGSCFAFAGGEGALTVRLGAPIVPTAFTLQHLHAALCNPVHNRECASAPREFRVFARHREDDANPLFLGSYEYAVAGVAGESDDDDDDGIEADGGETVRSTIQTFAVAEDLPADFEPVDLITLEVLSNHGHPDYTCVYRFRVHGEPRGPPAGGSAPAEGGAFDENADGAADDEPRDGGDAESSRP